MSTTLRKVEATYKVRYLANITSAINKLESRKVFLAYFFVIAVYTLAYGFLAFNPGLFWDDWTLINVANTTDFINDSYASGRPLRGYLILAILQLPGSVIIIRMLTCLFYFLSGMILMRILGDIREIDKNTRFFIVMFFLLFPVNFGRISITTFSYTVSYLLFFVAFWALATFLKKQKLWLRVLSLIIFFLSFTTNSLLVFYILVILYLLYSGREKILSARGAISHMTAYVDFVLLPIIFWAAKNVLAANYGQYANYNQITTEKLLSTPKNILLTFRTSFIEVIAGTVTLFFNHVVISLMLIFLVFLIMRKLFTVGEGVKYVPWMAGLGMLVFAAGAFPYVSVGLLPNLFDWQSRHQLLLPLGASLMMVSTIEIVSKACRIGHSLKILAFSVLISLFILVNASVYFDYQRDWQKQLSLMENLRQEPLIRNNSTFVFLDKARDQNAQGRVYRFYEYNGIMKQVFHEETRQGLPYSERNTDLSQFVPNSRYNMKNYAHRGTPYLVIINPGNVLTRREALRLFIKGFVDPGYYEKEIKNLLSIQYVKLNAKANDL